MARSEGRVVFVRHGLPGERVVALVTEDRGGSFCRADTVEVLTASPDRVVPPCPHAGPLACGGCDWQHATLPAQRLLKAQVVAEQLRRLGGTDHTAADVVVEEVPGGDARGLGWRTRLRLAVGPDGRTGLHRHRSHVLEPVEHCPQAVPGATEGLAGLGAAPGTELAVAVDADGTRHVTALTTPPRRGRSRPAPTRSRVLAGAEQGVQRAAGREFAVPVTGFWQGHTGAAQRYAEVVAELAAAPVGGTAWDLYGGVGLFAAVLAEQVGPTGSVTTVEGSRAATGPAADALADLGQVDVVTSPVERALPGLPTPVDVVVLDPPRSGAGRAVLAATCAAGPERVVLVSCDPAALGRDVGLLREGGYRLVRLRAFDAFPQTQHVECIALFVPDAA
ncbi:TRAM domain-containing protein [Rhodococcus aerolatus]